MILDGPDADDDIDTDIGDQFDEQHAAIADIDEQHAIVSCTTIKGEIVMHMHRSWSPNGYDRAVSLFERGYYDSSHFFRVVPHFLVQFGISYTNDMELKRFADTTINDDPKRQELMPFREGYMSYAGSGPNSRSSQLFIAYDRASKVQLAAHWDKDVLIKYLQGKDMSVLGKDEMSLF